MLITLPGCALFAALQLHSPAGRSWRAWRQCAVLLAAGAAVFLSLTAPCLFPFMTVLANSSRAAGLDPGQATVDSFNPRELLQLWQPFRYHDPFAPENYRSLHEFWETAAYAGISPWLLLAAGLAAGAWRGTLARWSALLALLALGLSCGGHTMFYPLLLQVMPLLNRIRVPGRFLLLFLLGFALLAAIALDYLRRHRPALQRRSAWLLLPLLAIELALAAWPVLGRPVPARLSSPYWSSAGSTSAFLQAQPGPFRIVTLPPHFMLNEALDLRVENCGGDMTLLPRRYLELVSAFEPLPVSPAPLRFQAPFGPRGDSRVLLDLLAVRYVVAPPAARPGGDSCGLPVHRDGDVQAWLVPDGPGRAWLAHACVAPGSDSAVLAALAAPGFDPAATALVAGDCPPAMANRCVRPDSLAVTAAPGAVAVDYRSDTDGILVFSEHWGAGWEVTLDGVRVRSFPANHALIGIFAPAGSHRAIARFTEPYPLPLALAVSAALLLLAAGLLLVAHRHCR